MYTGMLLGSMGGSPMGVRFDHALSTVSGPQG